jgi:hypothetical protein
LDQKDENNMGRISILWILSALVFVLGCGRIDEDLSKDPKYSYLIGKRLRTKYEMLIYKDRWDKQIKIRLPGDVAPEKHELKNKFPQKWRDRTIYGLLSVGTELEVTQVRREGSPGGTFRMCYVRITKSDSQQFIGIEVLPFSIDNAFEDPPTFDPEFVEELPAEE